MRIVVVGGGKVGFYLTQTLLSHRHEPHVIEKKRELCVHLANSLDVPITCGDGSLIEVLELAGTQRADAIVSATGTDENNLIICQLAKKRFGVKKTVARVNNPKNTEVMRQLGVDIPISATDTIAMLLEREVDVTSIKLLATLNQGEASVSELQIPESYALHGIQIGELELPLDSIIVSITRENKLVIPRGNSQILSGDKVVVISKNNEVHGIIKALKL